jgi:hypothetical protein
MMEDDLINVKNRSHAVLFAFSGGEGRMSASTRPPT